MKATINTKTNTLVVEIPLLDPPQPSSTGRTLLIANTGGNQPTDLVHNGKMVKVSCYAFIKKD